MELVGDPNLKIICLGEAMLELSRIEKTWQLCYGGDTLNTAIHLARSGLNTAYLTALGDDHFSIDLRNKWAAEGLDCSLVLTDPDRGPGLYAISNDANGERSFTYWRDNSAAKKMFSAKGIAKATETAVQADALVYSLITLAILPEDARTKLYSLCAQLRKNGGKVAFDGNYRARLWANKAEAAAARDNAIAAADIGLPTLEDEVQISGETSADVVARHWQNLGCKEVIVKLGAQGCRLPDGTIIPPPEILSPVDTSGAGDAFNGGYLAARFQGATIVEAAMAGHQLAGWVVMRQGAIPPCDNGAPY